MFLILWAALQWQLLHNQGTHGASRRALTSILYIMTEEGNYIIVLLVVLHPDLFRRHCDVVDIHNVNVEQQHLLFALDMYNATIVVHVVPLIILECWHWTFVHDVTESIMHWAISCIIIKFSTPQNLILFKLLYMLQEGPEYDLYSCHILSVEYN